jgi:hypothetical protein
MSDNLDDSPNHVDITPAGSAVRIFKNIAPVDEEARAAEAAEFIAYDEFINRKPELIASATEKLTKLGLTNDEIMAMLGFYTA